MLLHRAFIATLSLCLRFSVRKLSVVIAMLLWTETAISASDNTTAQLNSVLWTQQSLEHQQAAVMAYSGASSMLQSADGWATVEQGPATAGKRAVVLDLDETVLDNSAYNAWLIQRDRAYDETSWQQWMASEEAAPIPGALEFTRQAEALGIDVFYISNRECVPVPADSCPALTNTRSLLARLGFPRADDAGAFLLKGQESGWTGSDKGTRRQRVAQTHRIVMLVGDDLRDFLPTASVERLRKGEPDTQAQAMLALMGRQWFIVPNPMYGSWEKMYPGTVSGKIALLKTPVWNQVAPSDNKSDTSPQTFKAANLLTAKTLKIATWNMAWLANEPLTAEQAANCLAEAKRFPQQMDSRPSVECRKGKPFRQREDYVRLARHARQMDVDIVGLQEIQGLPAIRNIFDGGQAAGGDATGLIPSGSYFLAAYSKGGWQKTGMAIRKSILDPNAPVTVKEFTDLGAPLSRDRRGALEVGVTLKNGSRLTLLSVHLKSRCVSEPLDNTTNPNCPTLSKQAPVLGAWMAEKEKAGERYIILGDFNRSFEAASELKCGENRAECQKHSLASWLDDGSLDSAPVVVATAKLHHPEGCFEPRYGGSAIEHIVFGGGAESALLSQSVSTIQYLDPLSGFPIKEHAKSEELYSDHCVVMVNASF